MDLKELVGNIKGVGPAREKLLSSKGILSAKDILNYLPTKYDDSSNIFTIKECYEKISEDSLWEIPNEKFAVRATLNSINRIRTRSRLTIITADLIDPSFEKKLKVIWFNQDFIFKQLKEGSEYVWFGKVKKDGGSLVLQSPIFEEYIEGNRLKDLGRIIPVYRRVKNVTTKIFRTLINGILPQASLPEYLPAKVIKEYTLETIQDAYSSVHAPKELSDINQGRKRIELQELLEIKAEFSKIFKTTKLPFENKKVQLFSSSINRYANNLPFELTKSQLNALSDIQKQFEKGVRLDSLVYGDVGSGKTIVALLISLAFAKLGKSTILIAPTTILAEQHVQTTRKYIIDLGIPDIIEIVHVKKGEFIDTKGPVSKIYIGTHAILHNKRVLTDDTVSFVCIDEQHRFGVKQRELLDPNKTRHTITLSATPIPRTLAISFLGFSQAIFIHGKPKGRQEIITKIVPYNKERATYEWIKEKVKKGAQVYFVFPRIEADDEDEKRSLLASAEQISKSFLRGINWSVLHGKMKEVDKTNVMDKFSRGEIKALFSTSVIEVGIDVPDATIIAIHGAELFGLAQLHQLRGRVGRSEKRSYCYLFPGDYSSEESLERLNFFSNHSDGMEVAEFDLNNRGMGKISGVAQSGMSELKIASFENLGRLEMATEIYNELDKQKIKIPIYIR